jgi:hypothetical protein
MEKKTVFVPFKLDHLNSSGNPKMDDANSKLETGNEPLCH